MSRDSRTVVRFAGINTIDSPANVKPDYAIDCRNVIGTPSGELWAARLTKILIDFGLGPFAPVNISRIVAIGVLDTSASTGAPPRLLLQQGGRLFVTDSPSYLTVDEMTDVVAPINPGRLDFAQVASVLYFSAGTWGGKMLPGDLQYRKWGIAQAQAAPTRVLSTTGPNITVQRTGGVTIVTFPAALSDVFVGDPVYVDQDPSAPWDITFAGLFPITGVSGATVTYADAGPDAGPFTRAVYPPGLTATSYQYRSDFGATVTGHWGTASNPGDPIAPTGEGIVLLSPPVAPADPQVDQFALFRNLDEGGDWYLIGISPLIVGGPFAGRAVILDTTTDDQLETSAQTPPYDNGVSPNGKYICASLDRIIMAGILGNEEVVQYSGFESINFGRPQESWPFFNTLNVGQGQSTPIGIGNTRYGAVVFCTNKTMYILYGSLNDITTSAVTPLGFSMKELPYKIGTYSHYAIQSTPQGVIWLDDTLNFQMFDGYNPPTMVAPVLNGVMSKITPGSQDVVVSTYVAYLDRLWYILSFPAEGSATNNRTVILDITPDPDRNSGAWVFDYSLDALVSILNQDGTRHLIAAQFSTESDPTKQNLAGFLTELPFYNFQPGDPLMPSAHWRAGFVGIKDEDGVDEWAYYKMFRFVRLMTEQGLTVYAYMVDGGQYTFTQPLVVKFTPDSGVFSVNLKCRAISLDIIMPDNGSGDPITGYTINWVFTGKR